MTGVFTNGVFSPKKAAALGYKGRDASVFWQGSMGELLRNKLNLFSIQAQARIDAGDNPNKIVIPVSFFGQKEDGSYEHGFTLLGYQEEKPGYSYQRGDSAPRDSCLVTLADVAAARFLPTDYSNTHVPELGQFFDVPFCYREFITVPPPDCSQY